MTTTLRRIMLAALIAGLAAAAATVVLMKLGAEPATLRVAPAIVAAVAAMSLSSALRRRSVASASPSQETNAGPVEPRLGSACAVCAEVVATLDGATGCEECGETLHRRCAEKHDCGAEDASA
jgi:hypothetical protein